MQQGKQILQKINAWKLVSPGLRHFLQIKISKKNMIRKTIANDFEEKGSFVLRITQPYINKKLNQLLI